MSDVSDDQIRQLQQDAMTARDVRGVKQCAKALHGDTAAREECARAIDAKARDKLTA